jgi:hypothetical protein
METKPKYSRRTVASLYKGKNGGGDYVKINLPPGETTLVLQNGDILNFETQKSKLASIQKASEAGTLVGENLAKALERANNIPNFVRGELVQVKKSE